MIAQGGGKIVNISSGSGKTGSANNLAYTAACFAQVGMTQSMADELGPHNINVNCICPGAVDTSRVDDVGRGEAWQSRLLTTCPSAGPAQMTKLAHSSPTYAPKLLRGYTASPLTWTAAARWCIE